MHPGNLQYHFMEETRHIRDLSRLCLSQANSSVQHDLENTYYRNLKHYRFILAAIPDPAVSFTYALFIKNQVLGRQTSPFEPEATYEELFQVARETPLYQQVMAGCGDTGENSKNSLQFSAYDSTMSSYHQSSNYSEAWLTWVLYLNALTSAQFEAQPGENRWEETQREASTRLCCSPVAKLVLRVLSQLPGCEKPGNGNLELLLRQVGRGDHETEGLVWNIRILEELLVEAKEWSEIRFVRIYGEQVLNFCFDYLGLVVSQGRHLLLPLVLSMTKEYYGLHEGADRPVISFQQDSDTQSDVVTFTAPSYLPSLNLKILIFIQTLLPHVPTDVRLTVFEETLQIITMISSQVIPAEVAPLVRQAALETMEPLLGCIEFITDIWRAQLGSSLDDQCGFEATLIETYQAVADNRSQSCAEFPPQLLQKIALVIQTVIERCPVSLAYGENSLLPKISQLLLQLGENNTNTAIEDLQCSTIQAILSKCYCQVKKEQFSDYTTEQQHTTEYFKPILALLEACLDRNTAFRDQVYESMLSFVENSRPDAQGWCFLRLCIEWVKEITTENGEARAYEKSQFVTHLYSKLSDEYSFEALMLLDAITDQIVAWDANEFNEEDSYLWSILSRKYQHTFNTFTTELCHKMVGIVSASPSKLLANYSISLMIRLTQRLKNVKNIKYVDGNGKKLSVIKLVDYLNPIIEFTLNVDMGRFGAICHHEQRSSLFRITGLIAINSLESLHLVYDAVLKNLQSENSEQQVLYLTDIKGLMRVSMEPSSKRELIERFFQDTQQNKLIWTIFNEENLSDHEDCFVIFTEVLLELLQEYQKVATRRYSLTEQFQSLEGTMDVLSQVYGPGNFEKITEVYLAYTVTPMLARFPRLPQVLLGSRNTRCLVRILWKQIQRLSCPQDIQSLYMNTFCRKCLIFQDISEEEIKDEMKEEVADIRSMPEYLLDLLDYLQINNQPLFFSCDGLVSQIVLRIAGVVQDEQEESIFSMPCIQGLSIGEDLFDDKSQTDVVEEMFSKEKYSRLMRQLATALHTAHYLQGRQPPAYREFELEFRKKVKKLVEKQRYPSY